nr:MAG TPA: large terminase [Caudoviricetes sp.]
MNERRVNVAELIAPSFDGLFFDVQWHRYTHYWLAGGRGSAKSSFASLCVPLLLLQHSDCHAVVLRKVGNTLRNSVYHQVEWAIDALKLSGAFAARVSPLSFEYRRTGQKILFLGVDDKSKVKSIKLPFGYIGVVWLEELDQFTGMEEVRSLLQSLLRGGARYWVFASYNPPKSQNNWVNEEALFDRADRTVHHSTYLGVPEAWLGAQFLMDAEHLKTHNERSYRHEYLGEVTGTGGAVFENVEDRRMTAEEIAEFDRLYYGLDFGFSVDPLAFVALHYDAKRETVYIFDELYQQKLSNRRATEWILPRTRSRVVMADSAEPKSIAEMRGYGLNVLGVKKGPDSVAHGIKWLQDRAHIFIDKQRAPNTYREFVTYEYERNRQGRFVSAYPDRDNHAIDAVRYALSMLAIGCPHLPKISDALMKESYWT